MGELILRMRIEFSFLLRKNFKSNIVHFNLFVYNSISGHAKAQLEIYSVNKKKNKTKTKP